MERLFDSYFVNRCVDFQSTLHVCGATLIHDFGFCLLNPFNPRSTCVERLYCLAMFVILVHFQSTLHVCGATYVFINRHRIRQTFNPRSTCVERLRNHRNRTMCLSLSIHAPRVWSDMLRQLRTSQDTLSIHAPRVWSDRAVIFL